VTEGENASKLGTSTAVVPAIVLAVDLPTAPIFKDTRTGQALVAEVTLEDALAKYSGEQITDKVKGDVLERLSYRIVRPPPFLILHVNRFTRNNYHLEKNLAVIRVPVAGLDLSSFVDAQAGQTPASTEAATTEPPVKRRKSAQPALPQSLPVPQEGAPPKYDLIANVCHRSAGNPDETQNSEEDALQNGSYVCNVYNAAQREWYELHNLAVRSTMPQLIEGSQTYLAIYRPAST